MQNSRPQETSAHPPSFFEVGELGDPSSFSAAIRTATSDTYSPFPIPQLPVPPRPTTGNRGSLRRWRAASTLWGIASRIISTLNREERARLEGSSAYKEPDEDSQKREPAGRIPAASADARVKRIWLEILKHAKILRAGRRASVKAGQTGTALWDRLSKALLDCYGRILDDSPYRPVRSDDVKELPIDAPTVQLLSNLPGQIAEILRDPARVERKCSPEDTEMLRELNRRYSSFGGPREEYGKYLRREDVREYFVYKHGGEQKGNAAFLAVGRRKDNQQRKIWACVPMNFGLVRPEEVLPVHFIQLGMMAAASLGLVACDRNVGLWWGSIDCSQAFTAVVLEEWMMAWQAGPAILAREIPKDLWPPNSTPSTKLRPWYRRLAMGGVWSVLILMWIQIAAAQHAIRVEPRLRGFVFLNLLRDVLKEDLVRGIKAPSTCT